MASETKSKANPEHKPEPSYGPDEEGEVPLNEDAIPKHDKAAWVHEGKGGKPPPR